MFSERSAIFEMNVLFPEYLLSLKYMLLYFTKDFFIRLTSPTDTKSAMLKLIKQQFNKHQDLLSCYTTLNTASIIKQKEFYFFLKVVLKELGVYCTISDHFIYSLNQRQVIGD